MNTETTDFIEYLQKEYRINVTDAYEKFVKSNLYKDPKKAVAEKICERLNLRVSEVLSPCRKKPYAEARYIIIGALRELGHTWVDIGMIMSGRDHSTVIMGHRKYNDLICTDKNFRRKVEVSMSAFETL